MYSLTEKLLAGSGISPQSHPVLVALLNFAAQRPRFSPVNPTAAKRVLRQWEGVGEAFRAVVAAGVSDSEVLAVQSDRLAFDQERGWEASPFESLTYRLEAQRLLERAANAKSGGAKEFRVESFADLRAARLANGLPPLEDIRRFEKPRLVSDWLPGGRFVLAFVLEGLAVFTACEADRFGKVRALGHRASKAQALKACEFMKTGRVAP
jgi:hypothetical protein